MVTLEDLPLRAQKLSQDEMEGVFGGCKKSGQKCSKSKDCCDGKKCGKYEWSVADSAVNVGSMSGVVEGGWKVKTASKICGF